MCYYRLMCGRYYLDKNLIAHMLRLMEEDIASYQEGDVHPGDDGFVVIEKNGKTSATRLPWGIPLDKKLVFNARVESLTTKDFFKRHLHSRRCVVVARSFYEWNKEKRQYRFHYPKGGIMLMAGLYDEEGHFVIITKPANDSMASIHDRMPFLLTQKEMKRWLLDNEHYLDLLSNKMPPLESESMERQMSLFEDI